MELSSTTNSRSSSRVLGEQPIDRIGVPVTSTSMQRPMPSIPSTRQCCSASQSARVAHSEDGGSQAAASKAIGRARLIAPAPS
jgi:hypothetical protein